MLLGDDDDDDDDDIGSFNTHDVEGNARTSTNRLGFTIPAWPYASHFVGKFSMRSHLTTTMRNFMHISSATNFSFSFSF